MDRRGDSVTIRRVAQLAGVSPATVARAMGNYGSVSEVTRRKVMEAAQSLSYVPNGIAKSMRSQCTHTIGIIIGDIQAPFFNKLAFAIEDVVNRAGYSVLICNTNEQPEKELQHLRTLFERRVDGIIVCPTQRVNKPLIPQARQYYESDMPMIMVDRYITGLKRPLVQCDNIQGSYMAVKYLLGLGHRKFGVIASNQYVSSTRERLEGFRMALAEYGMEMRPETVRYCEESYITEVGRLITGDLLDKNPDITALYLLNNPLYKSAWLELRSRGVRVPEDLSLLGWGDVELAEAWNITAVTQPIKKIGVCAAEMMLSMIHNGNIDQSKRLMFETALVYRASCGLPKEQGNIQLK